MYDLFKIFNFLPDYPNYMSDEAKAILNKGYLLKAGDKLQTGDTLTEDETPKTAFMRVAQGVYNYIQDEGIALDLYEVLYRGYLGLATPVFTNFNAERGLPISCFLVHIGDNIESIYGHKLTLAQLSKHGGGTAVNLSEIRPTGSLIKHGGTSTGVLPWAREYDLTASVITQGSTRRGNVAIYLDIEHPDLGYLLQAKDHTQGDPRQMIDANLGVTISDKFIKEMVEGDEKKKALFSEVLLTRLKTGSPYIVYLDNANKQNPPEYDLYNLKVSMSNLCLTGDTLVATKQGVLPISNLLDRKVTIYDGENWVENDQFFYMGKSSILEVELRNGDVIKMTPDHRCFIQKRGGKNKEVKAKDLKVGDNLCVAKDFRTDGYVNISGAYIKGFLMGDGTSYKNLPMLNLHSVKYMCEDKLLKSLDEVNTDKGLRSDCAIRPNFSEEKTSEDERYYGKQIFKRMSGLTSRRSRLIDYVTTFRQDFKLSGFYVWDVESRLEFLSGLLDADGTYDGKCIQLSNVCEEFIDDVRILINSLGYKASKDVNLFSCGSRNNIYRLTIPTESSYYLLDELHCQRLKKRQDAEKPKYNVNCSYKIKKITLGDETEDVYCTKVPTTQSFSLANGVLTGNCSEIMLHTNPDHSAVCCLSSINVATYDQWQDFALVSRSGLSVPQLAVILLDAVMEEFIKKGREIQGIESAVRFAEKSRAIGVGTMGLHLYYQKLGLAFNSLEAEQINIDVHKFIKEEAVKASYLLASKLGFPQWCRETKRRNSHLLAIAPTRTNSIISGAFSAGIEPIDNNYFVAKEAKTSYVRKNPILVNLINSKFEDEEKKETIWDSILSHKGSIQHLHQVFTKKEREIFKTAREIDAKSILRQARDRVPFICQGQSINLYVDPEISNEELWEIHLAAWVAGIKSLYYLKSSSLLVKKEAINDPDIVIITKEDCPWCQKLKLELTEPYKEITLEMAKAEGIWESEWRTVPQVFLRGMRIGGYEDYVASKGEGSVIEDGSGCTACEG